MNVDERHEHSSGTPSKCPETKRGFRTSGPDSAVSWCVAFAAFLINFIMAGLSRMSGILYVAFIDMFGTDRKGASMPFSVRSSTMNLLGPLVGILGQKYGVRTVSVLGGVIGTVSSVACFFVDDITWITVLWGGLNGVGTALVTTLATVVVDKYFDKYRTTASGLAFSGACIGSFIFPPLIEVLLRVYDLQGSFLIVAAIIMHTIPAAMVLRKPAWAKVPSSSKAKDLESAKVKTGVSSVTSDVTDSVNNGVDLSYLRTNPEPVFDLLTSDLSAIDKCEKCPPKQEILREMEDVYTFVGKAPVSLKLSEVPPKLRLKFECETSPVSSRSLSFRTKATSTGDGHLPIRKTLSLYTSPDRCSQCKPFILHKLSELYNKNENQIVSPFREKNLYSQVLKELRKLHKVYEAIKRRNIFASEKSNAKPKIEPKVLISKSTKTNPSHELWVYLMNSVKLHANPLFLLISLCRAVHFSTFIPSLTIIVDYAMDKGLKEEDGKYVIATLSVGDLLGRLCLGWITDSGFVSLPSYMLIAMITQAVFTALLPSVNSIVTLLPVISMYALLQGSVFVRHSVLISKYMRSDEQSIAMGCVNFFAGLLGFAVPAYVGFFRDTIGSYDGIFYCNAVVGALTGLVWIFEPFLVKISNISEDSTQANELKV